ncbi:ABC transporter substrate-binding protein [Azospirillum canadense]|uniref:ABC transporter substrate-binding protein n=1 Tax=Azospirillum canadense TaxID=403962 RepID=UPI002226676D|nr:ABC transporter substrate-binding protein [Azospirillum canadense]MCW2241330.1 branched-chain amino acid transport system substrate-binding protein [Azospirillum canadense]
MITPTMMKAAALALALSVSAVAPATADVVKVGIIGPFSGPYALFGRSFQVGIGAYTAAHGDRAGQHEVKFIYRDLDAPNPARAKAIAQELIVKDDVRYLGGVYFTPDALAIAPLLDEAKVPLVVFNAAASAITEKSPHIVRTSFTIWQNTVPAAQAAARTLGARKVAIVVSDYAPGLDAEKAFKTTFESLGGTIADSVRVPLSATDFAPVMQRIRDSGADTTFAFLPSGPATFAFVKAFHETGLKARGVKLLTTGDVVPEPDLPALGDASLGVYSTYHYASSHESAENKDFLASVEKAGGRIEEVTMATVGAYDGARLIYAMIERNGATHDPEQALAAVKGASWISPRGPVSIDPQSRHIRQTVYLRVVTKDGSRYVNKELDAYPDQPDYGYGLR